MRSSDTRQDLMKGCKELAQKTYPTELGLTRQLDKIFYEIINRMPEIKPQKREQQANYALAIRSYRLLHCALDIFENGYYEATFILLRSLYETYVQMDYFATHPEKAKEWIEEGKEFSQKFMRNHLLLKGDFYAILSNHYAHPHSLKVLNSLIYEVTQDGKISLNHYPVFDPNLSHTCLFVWIFLADKVINQIQRVYSGNLIKDKLWMARVVDIQRLAAQYMQTQKVEFKD